jgi:glycosyltransferase involved in cell wall biosynthesis
MPQHEIANLHKTYGVFLCPSRMDTQGVSRDEAMASGLVPITNFVGAIPEFVNTDSSFLCDPEDYYDLAESVTCLYNDAGKFLRMSEAAAFSIRNNRTSEIICDREVALIKG